MHGRGTANSVVEIAFAPIGEAVDHLVHQLGDLWFTAGHLARSEQRIEDATVLGVLGRVDLQRDQRSHVAEVDRVHIRREQFGVLQRHLDVGEAAEDNRRLRRAKHRRRLAQCLVHRLRLGESHYRLVDVPVGLCHAASVTSATATGNTLGQ